MALFFFSLNFFSKTLEVPISFEWRVYVCLDQCLIIEKFKKIKSSLKSFAKI